MLFVHLHVHLWVSKMQLNLNSKSEFVHAKPGRSSSLQHSLMDSITPFQLHLHRGGPHSMNGGACRSWEAPPAQRPDPW